MSPTSTARRSASCTSDQLLRRKWSAAKITAIEPGPGTMDTSRLEQLARPLHSVAKALETIAILSAIGGAVSGIAFANVTTSGLSVGILGGTSTTTSHPYVAVGIAIALESIVSGLLFWAVARGLRLFTMDLASRHDITLDVPHADATAHEHGPNLWRDVPDSTPPVSKSALPPPPPNTYASWIADPSGRHPDRWWDGLQWTQWVRDKEGGTRSEDPPVPSTE